MRRVYLDTSALIPVYREESATEKVLEIINPDDELFISDLVRIEFRSAFYRAVRMHEMSVETAMERIRLFELDSEYYSIGEITKSTWDNSLKLLDRYSPRISLRSLDSLHLALAIEIHSDASLDFFVTLDETLATVAREEGLKVKP